ncbi:CNP1-like family protein [Cupriavidus gilardii]|uniref:CNP1-like family protein n=1 Tax=Cupriavidus gilardii TaxID=82541 RepID=UPI001FC9CCC0|nr:CNP1-like family protein [Cupriavidus gilardii]
MTKPAGFGRRHAGSAIPRGLAAGLATLFALALVSACSTSTETPKRAAQLEAEDEEEPVFLLDRLASKGFQEAATKLPPPPADADLLPFDVSTTGRLSFAVDAKSLTVGEDGAVRYTAVVTSPTGVRNISYEGVRCDVFQRKLFATMPPGSKTWVPNQSAGAEQWRPMSTSVRNSYAATLAAEYLCDGRAVAGKSEDIVRAIRDGVARQGAYR